MFLVGSVGLAFRAWIYHYTKSLLAAFYVGIFVRTTGVPLSWVLVSYYTDLNMNHFVGWMFVFYFVTLFFDVYLEESP